MLEVAKYFALFGLGSGIISSVMMIIALLHYMIKDNSKPSKTLGIAFYIFLFIGVLFFIGSLICVLIGILQYILP